MRNITKQALAVAAGAVTATLVGVTVASAATGTPSASASPAAGRAHHLLRAPRLAGEVVSDSSSGGSLSAGQLVIKEPDGTHVTLSLASKTKAWKYQGFGVRPISESPTSVAAGEIVVVAGRNLLGTHVAVRILDLGFQAAS
ncbi:MAG: hypothetical protein WBA31_09265 [Candidatus Dormiibacterota bacterium]